MNCMKLRWYCNVLLSINRELTESNRTALNLYVILPGFAGSDNQKNLAKSLS